MNRRTFMQAILAAPIASKLGKDITIHATEGELWSLKFEQLDHGAALAALAFNKSGTSFVAKTRGKDTPENREILKVLLAEKVRARQGALT